MGCLNLDRLEGKLMSILSSRCFVLGLVASMLKFLMGRWRSPSLARLRRKWAPELENRMLRNGVALLVVEDDVESSHTLAGCVAPICLSLDSRGVSLNRTLVGGCFGRVQRWY